MSFLNRYNKEHDYVYNNSKKIGNAIYSVGSTFSGPNIFDRKGLVTKTNLDGEVIWEKNYDISGINLVFLDLVACSNGDILLTAKDVSIIYAQTSYLVRISTEGSLIWSKSFPHANTYDYYSDPNLIGIGNENYFLVLGADIDGYVVYKIGYIGNILAQKSIIMPDENAVFSFRGITSTTDKIACYGFITYNAMSQTELGVAFEIDFGLQQITRKLEINGSRIQQLRYQNGNYITSNIEVLISNYVFFAKTNIQSLTHITSQISFLPLDGVNVKYNDDFIYVESYDRDKSVITKLNYDFEIQWTKEYQYVEVHFAWGILKQVTDNNLVILDGAEGSTTSIGFLNLEFDSCRTTILNEISLNYKALFLIGSTINYLLATSSFTVNNAPTILASNVLSTKEEICPTIIEDPCVKNAEICSEYSKLVESFSKCIEETKSENPAYSSNLSVFKNCYNLFLQSFTIIHESWPDLLLQEALYFQINSITTFINYEDDSEIADYYNDATSAVHFILDYLSHLGNCKCENILQLTEFASIQSGNLYLQAAGSIGADSTKGIHLRWTLKEGLSEHLPKGNYSSNTHNFNKDDDFVRIYRTKYVPFQVTLDFSNAPIQITDNPRQKNWIYEVGGKVFHVHFRNLTKYNQVRSTTNPLTDSLEFIQNYGDSLVEIEHKTELSFKILSHFVVTGPNDYVKIEVLSVPENKITAPKGVSVRKRINVATLNSLPLQAENIRSIRFSSTNCFITYISFEFYSDLILHTDNVQNWKFLGKYALTKEDNTAYQRLEPQPNCLNNWLRYNDGAFVNPANYHTKWNSNSIPIMERISTAVTKYIDLSEAQDNPRAVEYFPFDNYEDAVACGLTNPDYDPYIPETPLENTGIEIPFLDLLVLGSMDYHVARMLGLGMLDLNPLVFEGEYIYLSEYSTLGDLQDGLGNREVQHLYFSLPTSLLDQRLPVPIDLKEPVPGVFFSTGYNNSDVQDEDDEEIDHEHNNFTGLELTGDGYTADGKARYYSLFVESLHEEQSNAPFYYVDKEFIACQTTDPIFAGLEYRKVGAGSNWIKPELSYSPVFFNIDSSGVPQIVTNETVELVIPEQGEPIFTHVVKESGEMEYSSYGINWFSRATSSENVFQVTTTVAPTNQLQPPTNVTATLIQKESPLILTTSSEQVLYRDNPAFDTDKTLVRLTFEYNHGQELIDYHQKINGELLPAYFEVPNGKEVFAEKLQIFFRDRIPNVVAGKIKQINLMDNPLLVEVQTEPYSVTSSGINTDLDPQTIPPTYNETYLPYIVPGTEGNYVGSILLVDGVEFIVHEVDITDEYPKFIVFKADASGSLLNLNSLTNSTNEIILPEIGGLLMVVENMQTLAVWGLPNSNSFTINIDLDEVHREDEIIIKNMDCSTETHVQKFRGLYNEASIAKIYEKVIQNEDGTFDIIIDGYEPNNNLLYTNKHLGLYKVSFTETSLSQHSQYKLDTDPGAHSVEWFNGIVRLHTLENGGKAPRKDFKVVRTENIGTDQPLVLYIQDPTFPAEQELSNYEGRIMNESTTEITQLTNYYPGYKVYLYKDNALALNKDTVLPQGEDSIRYTVFGLRSWDLPNEFEFDNNVDFFSKMSVPTLMFATALAEPVRPQKPTGGLFATRPDYFGKSTYTFHTKYGTPINKSKPYSVQFNRASDIQFLSAIYDNTVEGYDSNQQPILNTVQEVMQNIFMNGEENFYVDRWMDLLSFNYPTGLFATFDGRTLPIPNNKNFIKGINDFVDAHNEYYNLTGNDIVEHLQPGFNLLTQVIEEGPNNSQLLVWHFMKDVLLNCFVPLTEIPVLYNYVKGGDYEPIAKKQVIRDRNGNLLKPTHSDFDMAPMMKRIDPLNEQYESKFTDFGLDGASNARYFYAAREINSQLKTSDYSPILGPISLVNTAPPIAPEIIKIIPILENRILGIIPSIQFQINAYPKAQNIAKISIYRAENPADALSIRTMTFVKRLDLEVENLLDESKWIFEDDFSDLVEVPFGDPLYYRVTVSRRIKYNDKDASTIVDYTPSEASKLIITNIVENYSPAAPYIDYYSEPLTLNNELKTVVLHWQKACYKAKYHLYKMNSQGNWVKIYELQNNDQDIYLPLELTELATDTLSTADSNGNLIYNHFKVITENTAGMTSREEYMLTVHNETNWQDIGGIGDMIVGGTFYIR